MIVVAVASAVVAAVRCSEGVVVTVVGVVAAA